MGGTELESTIGNPKMNENDDYLMNIYSWKRYRFYQAYVCLCIHMVKEWNYLDWNWSKNAGKNILEICSKIIAVCQRVEM